MGLEVLVCNSCGHCGHAVFEWIIQPNCIKQFLDFWTPRDGFQLVSLQLRRFHPGEQVRTKVQGLWVCPVGVCRTPS